MNNQDESLLLYLNEAIATTRTKEKLFKIVTEKLRLIFPFDSIAIITFDSTLQQKRIFLRDLLDGAPPIMSDQPDATPIAGSPIELFLREPRVQQVDIADLLIQYPDYLPFKRMYKREMPNLTISPLRTSGQLVGLLVMAARRRPTFAPDDLTLLEKIGSVIAVAVSNALAFEEVARREQEKSVQLSINNALLSSKNREQLFHTVATELDRLVPCDYFGLRIQRRGAATESFAEFAKLGGTTFQALSEDRWEGLQGREAMQVETFGLFAEPGIHTGEDFIALTARYRMLRHAAEQHGTRSMLGVPLWVKQDHMAVLVLASRNPHNFTPADLELVKSLAPQFTLAMQNLFAFEQIEALRAQLEQEKTYLIDEINTTAKFEDFVGPSGVMQQVQTRIRQVAPTDTTVLIQGETGTGKELAARALHNLSPRRERALIKLNCAALPAQLIESELFGHEKGAFTGAHDRRIGKFEMADGGTIFLDEVGELPLDLQAKLLRVLQEKEFERIGGRRVIKSDARVIAATNRILEDEVAAGRFRADLYYRLNVFPIRLPALRERPDDIEPLMRHFLERFTKQMGKPVRGLRERDLRGLRQYGWPGNVRELEHVLEQAVIVSEGPFLEFAGFSATRPTVAPTETGGPLKTLKEQERDHILAALHRTGGRVSGPNGAAVLLDINPKTLEARMKKLGIQRTVGVAD
ncbi:sigma 54-interacting transcriptional regulator [Hymenobacter sp. BT186]|uniref:Sigma 54-interacting transcriptional regulator n=1 Tax=Hymenobacter telluris TaxID=2816474 RepID=A0A939J913_9BACT|nr:sigma 54-interacting transcriptional regulator [Hymenobacter telluris]MBO0358329.1 sigma 54-interacting transcriptional regulator [Hymenobacter telluris]MBW3374355.1 sigma 54-interacting transcriptional regulator [Hymenobacter norwichensis]